MIAVIDYDAGNIRSVEKAVQSLGFDAVLTRDKKEILNAGHVILPGVGAFGDAMKRLDKYGLVDLIKEVADRQIPLLGICLGQQLLFEMSEESPGGQGLGLLKGSVYKIPSGNGLKAPDIGWNSLNIKAAGRLFNGVNDGDFVYFVHSYYCKAEDREIVKAEIDYNVTVDASIEKDNIFACQFHPEKSSSTGLKILENFLKI